MIYPTMLLLYFSVLLGLLCPPAIHAELVRFGSYGISVDIPDGWQWDSTAARGRSEDGMLALQAYDSDVDATFQLNLYNNPEATAAYRHEFPLQLIRMMVRRMDMRILDRADTIVVDGIRGAIVHAEGRYPEPDDSVRSIQVIALTANRYSYILMTTKNSGKPEDDPTLARIIASTKLSEPRVEAYDPPQPLTMEVFARIVSLIPLIGIPLFLIVRWVRRRQRLRREREHGWPE